MKNSKGEAITFIQFTSWCSLNVEEGEKIEAGKVLVKIPRKSGKAGDITGGLPELPSCLKLVTHQTQQLFLKLMVLFLLVKLNVVIVRLL